MAAAVSAPGCSAKLTSDSRASVTPRQADRTMASRGLADASTMAATRRKHPASATLDPPNLCTTHLSILYTAQSAWGCSAIPFEVRIDELRPETARQRGTLIARPGASKGPSSLEKVACGAFSDISFVSAGKKRG